jgi:hypothetical protein
VNNPERKTHLEREIEAADRQIDQLVYELGGKRGGEPFLLPSTPSFLDLPRG